MGIDFEYTTKYLSSELCRNLSEKACQEWDQSFGATIQNSNQNKDNSGRSPEIVEAFAPTLRMLDHSNFNFFKYDQDQDGVLDLVIVLHVGFKKTCLWKTFPSTHEISHVLGIPDLFDLNDSMDNQDLGYVGGLGRYDIMVRNQMGVGVDLQVS